MAQLSHWRIASAAVVFVLAGSSAVALAMHDEPSGAYQSLPASPVARRSPATGDTAELRYALCDEAIRLARLLLRLFPGEAEITS